MWGLARAFSRRIGIPPGGRCLVSEVAWRVVLIVQAYEQEAEMTLEQAKLQAVIAGTTQQGYDSVVRAFRMYRESMFPWMESLREEAEADIRAKVEAFSARGAVTVTPVGKGAAANDKSGLSALRVQPR